LPQAARVLPLQEGPVRQPAWPAGKKPAGIAGRGTRQEGDRHRERQTPSDQQARGGRRPAGQQIGRGRAALDQDADRHVARRRKEGRAGSAEKIAVQSDRKEVVQQLIAPVVTAPGEIWNYSDDYVEIPGALLHKCTGAPSDKSLFSSDVRPT